MTTLPEICADFQTEVEALEAADAHPGARLKGLTLQLVRNAVEHVADYALGEIPALIQRSQEVITTLSAEAENPDDRQCRYRSRAAVLNLLVLADGIQSHHAGSRAQQRKTVDALRRLISSALDVLGERDEE